MKSRLLPTTNSMKQVLRFLRSLSLHKDKFWFEAHKGGYLNYVNRAIDFCREEQNECFTSLDF